MKQKHWDRIWYWWHSKICQPLHKWNNWGDCRDAEAYSKRLRYKIYRIQLPICRWLDSKAHDTK